MGPVQILVVGFDGDNFRGEILPEFRRLREHGIVRLLDLLVVIKDEEGNVAAAQTNGLTPEEEAEFGTALADLLGIDAPATRGGTAVADIPEPSVFDPEDVWDVADAIPNGTSAAIALIEHRWAIPLRDAIVRAGGAALADAWVHPADLKAMGLATSEVGARSS